MISTKELKEGDICWIWIKTPEATDIEIYGKKLKAIFNGNAFITRYNKNVLLDGELYRLSVYKFKKINPNVIKYKCKLCGNIIEYKAEYISNNRKSINKTEILYCHCREGYTIHKLEE